MLEGSSHNILNSQESKKNYNYKKHYLCNDDIFPVIEKMEEYICQSNIEDQKMFSRGSNIKEDNNKESQIKDSIISKILYFWENNNNNSNTNTNKVNKVPISKQKSYMPSSNFLKPKKSIIKLPSTKMFYKINNFDINKKPTFKIESPKSKFFMNPVSQNISCFILKLINAF